MFTVVVLLTVLIKNFDLSNLMSNIPTQNTQKYFQFYINLCNHFR